MSPEMLSAAGILRGVVAGVLLVAFISLWFWAYGAGRRAIFDAMARLPLEDDAYHTKPSRGTVP